MKQVAARLPLAAAVAALAACSAPQTSSLPVATSASAALTGQRHAQNLRAFAATCAASTTAGTGSCTNIELASSATYGPGTPAAQIPGFQPPDLQAAYNLPSLTAGQGQKLAVVVAYDAPDAAADLAVYRSTFGLPACTAANGCLTVLATKGSPDVNWSREAATDLEMASAVCPKCSLVLSEAKSNNYNDLVQAAGAAVSAGATIVNASFAVPEKNGQGLVAKWSFPGALVVAAAGDAGPGTINWPAAAPGVVAVAATTLTHTPGTLRGWTEGPWTGSSTGCSANAAQPAWQPGHPCSGMRLIADVGAVGDPQTPVAVYDSYEDKGWVEVGGTSVATPIVAGVYALAGNAAGSTGAASLYAHPANLHPYDFNAVSPAAAGGVGTPDGIGAF